jgi:hypothetical protein
MTFEAHNNIGPIGPGVDHDLGSGERDADETLKLLGCAGVHLTTP